MAQYPVVCASCQGFRESVVMCGEAEVSWLGKDWGSKGGSPQEEHRGANGLFPQAGEIATSTTKTNSGHNRVST